MHDDTRHAIMQAMVYDRAAETCFHPFLASRRNYDVICGTDSTGTRKCGVLEQSWRIGGASGAEVAALEILRSNPRVTSVHASCVEAYGECSIPAHACTYFRDTDDRIGQLTKYSVAEADGPLASGSDRGH
jgi:hypothetical protein